MSTLRRRVIGSFLFVLTAFNTACYSFVPLQGGASPKVGGQVRVRLSPEGTSELSGSLGPAVAYADGVLAEVRSDGTIVVGVDAIQLTTGADQFWSGRNTVVFAPRQVAAVEVRQLNRDKTRVAVIGTAVAVLAIFAIAIGSAGTKGQPDASGAGTTPPP